jgi:hypothetical protein
MLEAGQPQAGFRHQVSHSHPSTATRLVSELDETFMVLMAVQDVYLEISVHELFGRSIELASVEQCRLSIKVFRG